MSNKYEYSLDVIDVIDKSFYIGHGNLKLDEFKGWLNYYNEEYNGWNYAISWSKTLVNPPSKVISTWKSRRELGFPKD